MILIWLKRFYDLTNKFGIFGRQGKPANDQEFEERVSTYFGLCMEAGEIPTVEGLCLITSYDYNTLCDIERGLIHTSLTGTVKYAKSFISMYDASLATKGKIPSQVYVFRSKNFYGMRDVQDVNVTPVNNTMPKDVEGIIDQIPDALPESE